MVTDTRTSSYHCSPRVPPICGLPQAAAVGTDPGPGGVGGHDVSRNLKRACVTEHTLLTLAFYPDGRRAPPKLLLSFNLDPK